MTLIESHWASLWEREKVFVDNREKHTNVFHVCDREREYNIQINCKIQFWCPVVIVSNNRGVCVCACIFLLGLAHSTHTHTRLRLTHWAVICCPEGDTGLYYYTTIFRQKPWFSHTADTHLQKKHTTLTQCNEAMYEITDSILSIYTVKMIFEVLECFTRE